MGNGHLCDLSLKQGCAEREERTRDRREGLEPSRGVESVWLELGRLGAEPGLGRMGPRMGSGSSGSGLGSE